MTLFTYSLHIHFIFTSYSLHIHFHSVSQYHSVNTAYKIEVIINVSLTELKMQVKSDTRGLKQLLSPPSSKNDRLMTFESRWHDFGKD